MINVKACEQVCRRNKNYKKNMTHKQNGRQYVKILTGVFFTSFHFPKFLRLRPVFQELISTATTCAVSTALEHTRG